ncbi:hypothetical protein RND71_009297 [Anisodus tanguticus]|uniref:Uncharacterized protein n=1 Tax=Anisodus tanguticus TaxID=243964 RepID=A0AAE1SHI1_9SOLA|nr:hypothetical protein RND71_009297 [Anisodus tanguticus]
MAMRKYPTCILAGRPVTALNSKLVSAAMAVLHSLLLCSNTANLSPQKIMVFDGESILGSENPVRVCVEISALKKRALEKQPFFYIVLCGLPLCQDVFNFCPSNRWSLIFSP